MRSAVSAIEKMDAWIAKMKDGQEKGDYGWPKNDGGMSWQ
jgi:predicted 3-demethylubiquinone-9 3-methyltransferase (glyoxalase superfamily)